MKLLLIDSRIKNKEVLIASRKSDVEYVVYNRLTDTYQSLLNKIGNTIYSDIALVNHASSDAYFTILAKEDVLMMYDESPYQSFNSFKQFLLDIQRCNQLKRFDMLACSLYNNANFREIVKWLEQETAIDLRASINFTGSASGADIEADWIMESDNVDIRDNYFTNDIVDFKEVLLETYYGTNAAPPSTVIGTSFPAMLAVTANSNQVYIWGVNPSRSTISIPYSSPILTYDESISVKSISFGISIGSIILSNNRLRLINTFDSNNEYVNSAIIPKIKINSGGITYIYDLDTDIADIKYNAANINLNFILLSTPSNGGYVYESDYSTGLFTGTFIYKSLYENTSNLLTDIVEIASTAGSFIARASNGDAYIWGLDVNAGNLSNYATKLKTLNGEDLPAIQKLYTSSYVYVLLTNFNTIYIGGYGPYGGSLANSLTVPTGNLCTLLRDSNGNILTNVTNVFTNSASFAAISNGNVYTWGNLISGGSGLRDYASGNVANMIYDIYGIPIHDVTELIVSIFAYAGIRNTDGACYYWGNISDGGSGIHTANIAYLLCNSENSELITGITKIYSTNFSFAALTSAGEVYIWGDIGAGGSGRTTTATVPTAAIKVKTSTGTSLSNIVKLHWSVGAYIAIDANGYGYIWGNILTGGSGRITTETVTTAAIPLKYFNQSGQSTLVSNIKYVTHTTGAFLAVTDTDVFIWGSSRGGSGRTTTDTVTEAAVIVTDLTGKTINIPGEYAKLTVSLNTDITPNLLLNKTTSIVATPSAGIPPHTYTRYEVAGTELIPVNPDTHPYAIISTNTLTLTNTGQFSSVTKKKFKCIVHNA